MEDAFNILKKVSAEPSRDECSLYAELLAKKLRDFDENTRELVMLEIDNYLYRLKYNPKQNNQNNLTSIKLTNSAQPFQNPHYPQAFPLHSSQSLGNQPPKEYSTLSSSHRPSQENFVISPQNFISPHSDFSYSCRPEYSTSSQTPNSQMSVTYSVPSPYSQTNSSNLEFSRNTGTQE